jgi:hypothetical protein
VTYFLQLGPTSPPPNIFRAFQTAPTAGVNPLTHKPVGGVTSYLNRNRSDLKSMTEMSK